MKWMKRKMEAGAGQDGRIENLRIVLGNIRSYLKRRKKKSRSRNSRNFQNGLSLFLLFLKTAGYNVLIVTKSQCDLNSTKEKYL